MSIKKIVIMLAAAGVLLFSACSDEDKKNTTDYEGIITAICDSIIENTDVPGIAIQIKAPDEGINLLYATGKSDLEQELPMRSDMTHRIGSVTKTFVITVMLQLIDAGELTLDTTLDNYYPQVPQSEIITMEMLSDMTSGLRNYMETAEFYEIVEGEADHYFAPDSLINISIRGGADFDPGTGWHYSNTNTIIIGRIIEMITGNDLKSELETRIFDVLGMADTEFLDGGTTIPGDHPQGYHAGDIDPDYFNMTEVFDISMGWAAGSIVSNIVDMQKYVEALVDGDLISADLQQLRLNCQNSVLEGILSYGIGMADYNGFFGHNGGFPGFTTSCYKSPDKNCSFLIFYNCQLDNNSPDTLFKELRALIYPDINWGN